MEKIEFVNGQEPALSAENLNQIQDNVENEINGLYEISSNSNGKYIKYSNGLKIQWGSGTTSQSMNNEYYGHNHRSSNEHIKLGNYPISFSQTPQTFFQTNYNGIWCAVSGNGTSKTEIPDLVLIAPDGYTATITATINWFAIGF